MDPITGALLAGAAQFAATETAKAVIKDAYEGLKAKVKQWFVERKRPDGEMALTMIEQKPDTWKGPLAEALKESGAADNKELLQAAQALMTILEEAKQQGTYHAVQTGSGAIAQGQGAVAAGARGIAVGGNVQGGINMPGSKEGEDEHKP